MAESDAYGASWVPQADTLLEGRYLVLGNLNRGGMGLLLAAHDSRHGTDVAIKLMSPKLARTGNYRERFEREVDLATRINHPNVIRCHDHGITDTGALFLVMELLDGLGLREVIRNEGRLSTKRTIELGVQLLDGLSAAHALGIVHRDLKPDNVYLVEEDDGTQVVKVLDFGLAKSLEDEHVRLTKTGMICGTAAYVAPETLVVEQPGREADVYAVGLILLEMLFGRRVYPSPQMAQTFMEQLVIPARIPRRVWDQPLGRILVRALQKHPGERYQDAGQMRDALAATIDQTDDFVLNANEIPPGANELPKELLEDLADGRYRTVDTLHKMPHPEPWDIGDEATVDDRAMLKSVIEDISRSDIHAAFDTILKQPASPLGKSLSAQRQHVPSEGGELGVAIDRELPDLTESGSLPAVQSADEDQDAVETAAEVEGSPWPLIGLLAFVAILVTAVSLAIRGAS